MSNTIILWDVATRTSPQQPISISTWRARYALNYLHIPHVQEWHELGEIEADAKKLGILPASKNPLGGDLYTCPVIFDPTSQRYIMDSYEIARYLEETYGPPKSKTGTLFPWGREEDKAWIAEHSTAFVGAAVVPLLFVKIAGLFSPKGTEYIRESRFRWFGKTLEELSVSDEERVAQWDAVRAYLSREDVSSRLEGIKEGITFRDAVIAATLKWIKNGARPGEFEELLQWDGGKWGGFFAEFEEFSVVHT